MTEIRAARFPEHLEAVRAIFREYAASLPVDLDFQNFAAELADLPGKYAEPEGRVLLAWSGREVLGSVAMRPLENDICEMKRLYVRPAGRGQSLGRQLAMRIVQVAKETGYRKIRLDTLPDMAAAQQLYASLGFQAIAAYVYNPVAGTQFLELDLA
ncbi:GNAT family N-acetyltransferase [Paraburkholderia megapolitana]|uniref:Ribosomal protein S18 acetylase RimI n=1 Tax=Paraburkholderia megapolitana TaxID=420953 RepID=A0A1I3PPM2_9BURK|nr:GNAT family N-acetyltransferase [Paraburkholderia megapolitana]QDQ80944.1 GNAT family N-acetyltransferase [Paraburkholderia megapolitana]SFJ23452.1 Ribosomal protein S18 acetylase RimI [Paraburkholderia megapolitana]